MHVPRISKGLISGKKFDKNMYKMVIKNDRVEIFIIIFGHVINLCEMYRLELNEGEAGHRGSKHVIFVLDIDFSYTNKGSIVIIVKVSIVTM